MNYYIDAYAFEQQYAEMQNKILYYTILYYTIIVTWFIYTGSVSSIAALQDHINYEHQRLEKGQSINSVSGLHLKYKTAKINKTLPS